MPYKVIIIKVYNLLEPSIAESQRLNQFKYERMYMKINGLDFRG